MLFVLRLGKPVSASPATAPGNGQRKAQGR